MLALRALLFALACAGALATGCGSPCDPAHTCAILADDDNMKLLCNGKDYVPCEPGNRNQAVACPAGNLRAVCTNSGWTVQNTK